MKRCIRCQKEINGTDNFIEIIEWDMEQRVKTNYCHKNCWLLHMNSKAKVNQSYGMLEGLADHMKEFGIDLTSKKKVVIQ